jgi:predicted DsbA family dithiol-disulfide isomerase
LLRKVGEHRPELHVRWSYFSLTQINDTREGWTVWDAPKDEQIGGRLAFSAAESSRRQGRFDEFHIALLDAHHDGKLDLEELETIRSAGATAGLDWERTKADIADPTILEGLARDHTRAVDELGVFGTPTFVFAGDQAAYVRIRPAPVGVEAIELFDQLARTIGTWTYVREIKRPARPRPHPAGG